ncbi:PAS domain S-box protein [Undibacterium sp.]|uniref:PAS domain S-box protein n=1 Tax=Undibacterium sp. TaxID=1914977 RepID=UPI0025D6CAB1|nr:PAS domain S-box protein [Undibacterium sp.]
MTFYLPLSLILGGALFLILLLIAYCYRHAAASKLPLLSEPEQLRGLLQLMDNGILVASHTQQIVFANPAALSILGLDSSQLPQLYDTQLTQFFCEDGQALAYQEAGLWRSFSSAEAQRELLLGISVSAAPIKYLLLNTEPIFSKQNPEQVEFLLITMRDITSARKAERDLREREAILARVFQLVPATLTITRMSDGHYIDVNRNWEPLSGFTREEALGRNSNELKIWSLPEQRTKMIEQIAQFGEVHNMIIAFRHKQGDIFQCRVSGSKFDAGEGAYLLLSVQNIDQEIATENAKIQAETLLRESEEKYSNIVQLSPIPLGLIRMQDSCVVELNDSWVTQFGYTREEAVGRTALEMNFWYDLQERERLMQKMREDGMLDRFEAHIRTKAGEILICLISVRSFVMKGEDLFLFCIQDVTRQYQVEQEIRDMTLQLEDRVIQRTLRLEHANLELANAMESLKYAQDELIRSEKMAALGKLVAGIAHELNTPIGNGVTVASTLQDNARALLSAISAGSLRKSTLQQYVQSALTGTDILLRSLSTARDLIGSFKQVAVDQASNQRRTFDLKTLLEEIVATLSPMYKKGPFGLVLALSAGITMDSFPGPLGQILTNFLSNALAHAFEGREQGEMRLSTRLQDPDHVELVFSDNGVGIAELDQKRVFDPFFTTKLGQGGSGLGMHIVYNITTGILGGTIRLESELGHGTRIVLVLPLRAPEIALDANA